MHLTLYAPERDSVTTQNSGKTTLNNAYSRPR